MLERVKYINHFNEEVVFGENGLFVNENDLHDFEWEIMSKNDKISSFKKTLIQRNLPVVFATENCNELKNTLFEVFEKDVLAKKHGKLYIGDYYLKCFVTGCKSTGYTSDKIETYWDLTIQTDFPEWIKETSYSFGLVSSVGKNLDYNNDFPYDYSSNVLNTKLINSDFSDTKFNMKVLGPAVNPKVTIGPNEYQVYVTLSSSEYLEIDSMNKKIIHVTADGENVNVFNKRNRDSYIFEKIPSGESNISLSGDFVVEITLLEERGVPKWI